MSKKMILKYICYASVLCAFSANTVSADTVETTVSTTSPSISTTFMEEVDAKGSSDNAAVVDTVSAEEALVPETSSEMTEVGNTAETVVTPVETTTEAVTDSKEALQEGVKEYRTDFDAYDETTMAKADWWNGNPFGAVWKPDQVAVENGVMTLTIDKGTDASAPVEYISGELRTQDFFHYGTYQVSMKPIKNSGTVSSFFTYTGPSDNNPWDEVDIEFLGKDTTKVQFNYYTNGKGEHEYIHELGFDASEAFHTYAFDWQKDYITWYVDGKAVYTATENLPVTPGRIMMNAWSGTGVDEWLEAFDGKTPLVAYYDWFSYSNKVADVTPLSESDSADNGVKPKKADDSASDATGQDVNTTIELKTVTNDKTVKVEASSKELGKVTRVANKDLVPLASVVSGKKLPNTGENSSLLATLLGSITALFTLLAWRSFKEND